MQKTKHELAILILAAGASKRMGAPKQLLPYKHKTLLGHAIEQAKQASKHVYVVLGANCTKIKEQLPVDVKMVENQQWHNGMGSSISAGMKAIENTNEFDALLIMLADQPLIESRDLNTLLATFDETNHQIVATAYQHKYGVPAIFDRQFFPELATLNADIGAKRLMEKYSHTLKSVDLGDKTFDIDTPETYKKLLTQTRK